MKVSNFDKPSIKAIRIAMDQALAKVEKEYGIKISTGNARFSGDEVTFKVKANTIGTGGTSKNQRGSELGYDGRHQWSRPLLCWRQHSIAR